MVHALHEAWRVLSPRGLMIDLRPLSIDTSLDIIYKGKNESAGIVDMSPDVEDDIAVDHAIESVIKEGIYKELSQESFELTYYWKTVKGMMADYRERWKDDVIIDDKVIRGAYELFRKHRPHARVRLLIHMKLAKYEKQFVNEEISEKILIRR
jgi:hypothetical protein